MKLRMRGVTLIELMVVIVVLAILASLAVPSYRRFLLRSQRTEAMRALMQAQTAQEKFFLQNNMYSDDLTGAPADGGLGLLAVTDTGKYDLSLEATAATFTVTASAKDGQRQDEGCVEFTINQAGTRTAEGDDGTANTAGCWR